MNYGYGVVSLLVLVLALFAIVKCLQSGAPTGTKVLWILLILILPLIGAILYLLLGPKGG